MALSLPEGQQAEIAEIARQINETIQNLTNIDQILNDTAADLITSEALQERARNARYVKHRRDKNIYNPLQTATC